MPPAGKATVGLSGVLLTLGLAMILSRPARTFSQPSHSWRPNRILLVIGDQWDDPSSFLVRPENEFHELASLLKHWGIPFDILRLDQQRLDRNQFLGYDSNARYGAVLWDADPVAFKDQNYELLADAVEK